MNHKFVDYIPPLIEEDTLYVSLQFNIAVHRCPCGCGDLISTSINPSRWCLYYNGETVSLYPSIGNWMHKCNSHYYIENDNVVWLSKISKEKIVDVIRKDKKALKKAIRRNRH